jgi:hypothetical protein
MGAFAYHRSAPISLQCHRHIFTIGNFGKGYSTGKTIARVGPGDAQGDALAADPICP